MGALEESAGEVRPYRVLDTRRRARAGAVYLAIAIMCAALIMTSDTRLMWLTAALPIVVAAFVQFVGSWKMQVSDMQAIDIASRVVSFRVGHGSATLGYRGFLAKPVWEVLVYADTPSPDHQGLVTVDAMSGDVTGRYEEAVDLP